ncbi:MAG TPA: DUF2804 domain-containing protein [Myxococcota bacterium]|nr:DUF2804 domain-containing protein [Myxococcota bacterium]
MAAVETNEADNELGARLPHAPLALVDERGEAVFGRWEGAVPVVTYDRLAAARALGRTGRFLREKRWRFVLAADERLLVGAAVADLGYLGLGFAYALERPTGRLLASCGGLTLSRLARVGDETWRGARTRWRGRGGSLTMTARPGETALEVDLEFGRRLGAALRFEPGAAPPLTLCTPVRGGTVNTTVKSSLLRARGPVTVDGTLHHLEGLGGSDYTHGLLGRETSWRWAFGVGRDATGRAVGFNLVTGFNEGGGGENALWAGEALVPLSGAPEIAFAGDAATGPWTVRTPGGEIDLRFTPAAARSEALDLKLIASSYVQPFGRFDGRVAGAEVTNFAGVVEDHYTKW